MGHVLVGRVEWGVSWSFLGCAAVVPQSLSGLLVSWLCVSTALVPSVVSWGLIHETDLRGKLQPKHEVRDYRRRLQFMRVDNAKLRPKLRPKLVKITPQLEVDYTL